MNKEKIIEILLKAVLQELCLDSIDDLILYFAKLGIKLTKECAMYLWNQYTWNTRKYIEYTPIKNNGIKINTANDLKKEDKKYFC